jgi:hypothetical protein
MIWKGSGAGLWFVGVTGALDGQERDDLNLPASTISSKFGLAIPWQPHFKPEEMANRHFGTRLQ